jgi:hypothetical protein
MTQRDGREGVHLALSGSAVLVSIETRDDPDPTVAISLTPSAAVRLAVLVLRYAWRAATTSRHHGVKPGTTDKRT